MYCYIVPLNAELGYFKLCTVALEEEGGFYNKSNISNLLS